MRAALLVLFLISSPAQAAMIEYVVESPEHAFHIRIDRDFTSGSGSTRDGLTVYSYSGMADSNLVYAYRPRTATLNSRLIVSHAAAGQGLYGPTDFAISILGADAYGARVHFAQLSGGAEFSPTMWATGEMLPRTHEPYLQTERPNFNLPLPGAVWLLAGAIVALLRVSRMRLTSAPSL